MSSLSGMKIDELFADDKQVTLPGIEKVNPRDIAVIGMSVRLSHADNLEEYWDLLKNGVDCIGPIPESRKMLVEKFFKYQGRNPKDLEYIESSYLSDIESFDYRFFGLSPKEAAMLDPNQRLFMECAWEALEDAGYSHSNLQGSRTGVYVGYGDDSEYKQMVLDVDPESSSYSVAANLRPMIASRLSYLLDLKGPSIIVDTTCSSSLVAVHMACQGLRSGDCQMAIAGGVKIHLLPLKQVLHRGMRIESQDGRTKTFDDRSDGTGLGEGVAAIFLKPLGKALRDRDTIYSVIKGSAINQDGKSMALTAPNVFSQEDVILSAWKDAGIDPTSISYIEAHGTGTKLGDPIEIEGISRAFGKHTSRKQFVGIGSVKTNLGHLDHGAGMMGLVKAILMLDRKEIVPNVHFQSPNRNIEFQDSPVYIAANREMWEAEQRRCGVSSFGLSGTNCHLVVEQAPAPKMELARTTNGKPYLLTVSAKSEEGVSALIQKYRDYLVQADEQELKHFCYTANTGRGHYKCRAAFAFRTKAEAIDLLDAAMTGNMAKAGLWIRGSQAVQDTEPSITPEQVMQLLRRWHEEPFEEQGVRPILRSYVSGTEIDWNPIYFQEPMRRLHIPTYPFQRERCWIELADNSAKLVEDMVSVPKWKAVSNAQERERHAVQNVLIIHGNRFGAKQWHQPVTIDSDRGIMELAREDKSPVGPDQYQTGCEESNLLSRLIELGPERIDSIVYTLDSVRGYDIACDRSGDSYLHSVLQDITILGKWVHQHVRKDIRLYAVLPYSHCVTGQERRLIPEHAAMIGFIRGLAQEIPRLSAVCLDVDDQFSADDVWRLLSANAMEDIVAYRNGVQWQPIFENALAQDGPGIDVKAGGTYIITGGTGGIGTVVAEYVARTPGVKLALLSRTPLPPRERWETLQHSNAKQAILVRKLLEIEAKTGAIIAHYCTDVADEAHLSAALETIREQYGTITGVFHCAGIAGEGSVVRKDADEIWRVLNPKVKGTRNIDRLTRQDNLDFMILWSSVSALMALAGQGDYAAGNAFLDTYASTRSMEGHQTLSINWAPWKEAGMALDYGVQEEGHPYSFLTNEEAMISFKLALGMNRPQVIIGKLKETDAALPATKSSSVLKEVTGRRAVTDLEHKLAEVWSEVLGISRLDIDDDFYEIGGHSLLAIKIEIMLERLGLPVVDVALYSTISKMAEGIQKEGGAVHVRSYDSGDLTIS